VELVADAPGEIDVTRCDIAQELQVLRGAVGEHGDIGLRDLREIADLAGMIGPDLEHEIILALVRGDSPTDLVLIQNQTK